MLASTGTIAIQTNQQQQHRYWIPSILEEKGSSAHSFQKMSPDEKKMRKKQKSKKRSSTAKSSGDEMIVPKGHKKRRVVEVTKISPMEPSSPIDFAIPDSREERKKRSERQARFQPTQATRLLKPWDVANLPPVNSTRALPFDTVDFTNDNDNDNDDYVVNDTGESTCVGRSTALVKPYLRLTTFPDPNLVRPLSILVKALAYIKNKYIQEEDFDWANEQLKSVRQDLTVQGIHNPFCLQVYETHARILLEHGDLNEFNQCQTMIHSLVVGKQGRPLIQSKESADEFAGYALLYALVRNSSLEINLALGRPQELVKEPLYRPISRDSKKKASKKKRKRQQASCNEDASSQDQKSAANDMQKSSNQHDHSYAHALSVVRAVVDDDYRTFFRLYDSAPHMSAYLMDFLVKRVRESCYDRVIAAYRPNVSVEQFREWLCFADLSETRRFLKQRDVVYWQEDHALDSPSPSSFWVDCKASRLTATKRFDG